MRRALVSMAVAVLAVLPIGVMRPTAAAVQPTLLPRIFTVYLTPSLCVDEVSFPTATSMKVVTKSASSTCIYQAIGIKCNNAALYFQQPSLSHVVRGTTRTYNACGGSGYGICYGYFQGEDYRGTWGDKAVYPSGLQT